MSKVYAIYFLFLHLMKIRCNLFRTWLINDMFSKYFKSTSILVIKLQLYRDKNIDCSNICTSASSTVHIRLHTSMPELVTAYIMNASAHSHISRHQFREPSQMKNTTTSLTRKKRTT
jgi:hypothetical protein